MNTYIYINSIALRKLLNRYKLKLRVKQEIIKSAQKKSLTWTDLNRLARKIEFKDSYIN